MIHCGNECPDHSQECAEFLELAGRLQATISVLQERFNNLSLKDLTDVNNCLAPLVNDHLVFKGVTWDAQAPDQLEIEVESVPYPIPIATITQQGCPTTLYCKDGTNVRIVPKDLGDDTITIADVYLDGQKIELKQKNYDNIELGDKVEIVRNIVSGTQIATFKITRDGTTQNTALYVPAVTVTNTLSSGTRVATIKVGSTQKHIYVPKATDVQVTPLTDEGKHIATINVDGVAKEIYSGADDGGTLDNVEVNGVLGEVNNKIAQVTVYGSDIETSETTFPESEEVNDDLEIEPEDKIDEALGKLQKALKDDEAAVTRAFLQIEDSTGFNDNLEYVPEESTTLLGNAKNLQDADAILMNNLVPLIQFKAEVLDINKIVFSGGTSGTVKIGQNALNPNNGYQIAIPYEGNCTNVTYRFPPATYASGAQYYTISTVISSLEQYLLPPLIFTGRVITFETAAKTWEWWQYVGPMSQGVISPADWSDMSNWKKLNISYA